MSYVVKTPILLNGYVQWVYSWYATTGESVYLYSEEFNTPYSPVEFVLM